MKRAVALMLAGACLLSCFLLFAPAVQARDVRECYWNHTTCRRGAFLRDVGWVRTTILLTACDISLGRCIYYS